MHYKRWWRRSDLGVGQVQLPWPENFLSRLLPQPNGCIWLDLMPQSSGYAIVWDGEKQQLGHRAAWILEHGPIPDGLTVDHECHNESGCKITDASCPHRRCVNVEHLALKSRGANTLASPNTITAINRAKTHCIHGHEFTEANTNIEVTGSRSCLACKHDKYLQRRRDLI